MRTSLIYLFPGVLFSLIHGNVMADPIPNNSRVLIVGPAAPTHASALQSLINGDSAVNTRGIAVDHLETDILVTKVYEGWGNWQVGGSYTPPWSSNALLKKLDLNFDLVVINPDRHILVFPEYFMEAVRLVKRYAEARGSQVALIVPPHSSSTETMYKLYGVKILPADNATVVKEHVYRIADALDLPVVPAGLTWQQLELDPTISTPAFPTYSPYDASPRPTHYNPDFYMVNVYATTLYSALFEATPAQSSFRYGGISNTDFTKVSNYAFQTWQSALTATHYTGPFLGPLSPVIPTAALPNLEYDPTRKFMVGGASTEAFTSVEFGNIFSRRGTTIPGNDKSPGISGVEYEFELGRGEAYGSGNRVGVGQTYKSGLMDMVGRFVRGDERFHNERRSANMRENPNFMAFTRLWTEDPKFRADRVGDGHLNDAAHMMMAAGVYAIMTGGKHLFLDGNADLIRWTGPQRFAASIGWGTVMGAGRLAKLKSPPVATAIPRFTVQREVANAVTLTGFDFDGLPMTAEIITPPSRGSLVPTGTSGLNFTYTPAAGFDGLDSVTYRVVNANGESQPLTVDFNVGPYQPLPVAGSVIFSENFEDQEISDWSASGITGFVTSTSVPKTYNGDPMPYDGSAGLRLQSFATAEKAIDTTAFTNVELTLRMGVGDQRLNDIGGSGVISNFYAQVEWYDGATWHPMITHPVSLRNHYLLQTYQVSLPAGAANNANFKIRLRANTSASNWTNAFFDSIVLSGDSIGEPGNTYAVIYNANGATSGAAPAAQSKTHDVALNLAANAGNLARTGYNFAGWNTAADGSGTSYVADASYATNASVTLYAKWTTNATTYAVTYSANGATSGTVPAAQSKTQDVALTVAGNTGSLARTGYNFVGWNTAADGNGTSYVAGASYTANAAVTLYAQWTATSTTATYPVSYDANGATGGTAPAAQTKTHDVALTLAGNPGNLVRTGYTFAGWDDNSGMIYPAGAIYTINSPVVLYARWNSPPVVEAGPNQTVILSGSAPWNPRLLNPVGWYDAGDTESIVHSNGAVSQWQDKSGNNLHLTQLTASGQPTTNSQTLNGRNAIQFQNDWLSTASNPFGARVNDAFVMVVNRIDNRGDFHLFSLTGDSASQVWRAAVPNRLGWVQFFNNGVSGVNRITASASLANGSTSMMGFYGSTTENVQQYFLNGALNAGDATGHAATVSGPIVLGKSAGTDYQPSTLGEVVIINGTVSAEARQKLEGYLAHKWGLANFLPAAHPHKTAAPGGTGVVVNLDGSASDPDGTTPTVAWTRVSGPAPVTFANPAAVNSTATFTQAGTYLLRLTASDGLSTTSDDVTITLTESGTTVDTNNNGIDDAWETTSFGRLLSTNEVVHQSGVPYYFMYLHGSDLNDLSDRFGVSVKPPVGGGGVTFGWEVLSEFQLGVDYDVRISTNLTQWDPIPAGHYTLDETIVGDRTHLELTLTHDYGDKVLLRLIKP